MAIAVVERPHGRAAEFNRVVDLDAAAAEIERSVDAWVGAGLEVGPITWRDEGDGWPWTVKIDRRQVRDPDAIGVTLPKARQEGQVVLFRGGWCDLEDWTGDTGDEPVRDVRGYPDQITIEHFAALLDRLAGSFE